MIGTGESIQALLSELAVGDDHRNRCLLSPYRAGAGRNKPCNSNFIFGNANWLRSLIQPTPEYGLAYLDWSQQEFGIAAALSNDQAMLDAYVCGDPYLGFAKGGVRSDDYAARQQATGDSDQPVPAPFHSESSGQQCTLRCSIGQGDSRDTSGNHGNQDTGHPRLPAILSSWLRVQSDQHLRLSSHNHPKGFSFGFAVRVLLVHRGLVV